MTRPKRGSGYLDMAPERGSTEREYNGRIGDVVGESAESGARRDPCGKVVSGGDPPSERENPLHYIPPSLTVDDPVEQRKSELGNPAHTHRR